ncbi:DUF5131 family protein [Tuwongella immobilis]|uniref:Phage Gp37Gp68 family protein n=1 Tax=Tuwongella immobilis TaxID=692036 RepID=A0A6C2YRG6_9BACT|nr:phage Gp37/Gp68 family protein [Tuwongella immobilis]VIP03951.1 Marine sediment metagenome DNA, contig: S12H4_L00981 OS=marine sediment metagenome GN=S12H4_14592 PE=4 SV=1: Gp37_Gp68 [Tuwongella immobilis]VTS05269.1 Marine sediment metagenome DNA, contig: S12H4_L00981 OS=marine sediment metagenome GN=S12H4_14592 PE=4 SV=1: Gp37_Gp68 [Tuwongella immobilis]
MAESSGIEWTDATWNPLTGCTKISAGCANCYAEPLSRRLQLMGSDRYHNGFELTLHEHVIDLPMRWKRPRRVFVNSMSDLFHVDVPTDFIQRVFATMVAAKWHQYQILTKRSDRLSELAGQLPWPEQIWQGVTVESAAYVSRIDHLRAVPAMTRFLSLEPLLGPIPNLDLSGIHWVIIGGESGSRSRPIEREWVIDIIAQCDAQQVPVFFKQWGGPAKHLAGRSLDGRTYDGLPAPPSQRIALPTLFPEE